MKKDFVAGLVLGMVICPAIFWLFVVSLNSGQAPVAFVAVLGLFSLLCFSVGQLILWYRTGGPFLRGVALGFVMAFVCFFFIPTRWPF